MRDPTRAEASTSALRRPAQSIRTRSIVSRKTAAAERLISSRRLRTRTPYAKSSYAVVMTTSGWCRIRCRHAGR